MLATGTRLGPYEILSPAGAGGMGEVYKARDTRLERTVAIKVLPEHLSASADQKQRFDREARAISSLNHPFICTLYDVGHQNGADYLVMEYLEGETLAARLEKGALPLEQLLKIGGEMAEALENAHRHGIVHRDLKPQNIMLTKSGAKLMDFGLSKPAGLRTAAGAPPAFSAAVTMTKQTSPVTAEGTIVGTFQYMSPEQIEGKDADARSDIFALGAVLYEMATGKRAFTGKSQLSVASAILERDPEPICAVQPLTPPALEHVVDRALAKDPDQRWQSAADVKAELRWIAQSGSQAGSPAIVSEHRKRREWTAWAIAALATLGVMVFGMVFATRSAKPVQTLRTYILPPKDLKFSPFELALSPDGTKLVFVANAPRSDNSLWVRSMGSLTAQELRGTGGASYPFWSPDSKFVGFFSGADGKLKKVEASGGPVVTVADAPDGRGGAWSHQGAIVFARLPGGGLQQVADSGGPVSEITKLGRWPIFIGNGNEVLFYYPGDRTPGVTSDSRRAERVSGLYSVDLKSYDVKFVLASDSGAQLAAGYLLYLNQGTLMAAPFDSSKMKATGDPVPVIEHVQYDAARWIGSFSVSAEGLLAYIAGAGEVPAQLVWSDRSGKQLGTLGDPGDYQFPALSPDGKYLAVALQAGSNTDIWVYELDRRIRTRLTFSGRAGLMAWSPNSRSITYRDGTTMKRKAISGIGLEETLAESQDLLFPNAWSPDGSTLIYTQFLGGRGPRLWLLDVREKKQLPLLGTKFYETAGQFSHDGKWLAYVSTESGQAEVYVAPYPKLDGKWQISSGGGQQPVWAPGDKGIFYIANDGKLMSAALHLGSALAAELPKALFDTHIRYIGRTARQYDVTPDGKRFLFNSLLEQRENEPITLLQNWAAGLKK